MKVNFINCIYFIKELTTSEGTIKYDNYKANKTKYLRRTMTSCLFLFISLFSICIGSYLTQANLIFLTTLIMITLIILNLITEYLYYTLTINSTDLFITTCQAIVKFEDFTKCIIKIKKENTKHIFINILGELIQTLSNFLEDSSSEKTEVNWESYLTLKGKFFQKIYNLDFTIKYKHQILYFLKENYKFISKLKKVKESYTLLLDQFKKLPLDQVDPVKLFESVGKENCYSDQLIEMIKNNDKLTNELIEALKLVQEKVDSTFVEKIDYIIDCKSNTLNILKQMKQKYVNNTEIIEHAPENDTNIEETFNTNKGGVSLYELELNEKIKTPSKEDNTSITMPSFSHYEILKGAEESKKLQMNLLFDLDEFQTNKIKLNKN